MVRLAAAQFAAVEDSAANLHRIGDLVAEAAAGGADLLVLPELVHTYDHELGPAWLRRAEPIGGAFTRAIDALADEHSVAIVVGMLEQSSGARPYNSLYATSSTGRHLATYRKVHLYDAFGFEESSIIQPSMDQQPSCFEVDGVRVGLMTCYDLRFPESARELVGAGAQVIVLPAAWVPGPYKEEHWETLIRARAIENTCFVAGVNQIPPHASGRSMVADPLGVVIGAMGVEPGVAFFTIEPSRVDQVRRTNPSLANRRMSVRRTFEHATTSPESS